MNEIKIFENSEFGRVRVELMNNDIYFCLKDVCEALSITNATMVANRLDADEVTKLDLGGKVGSTNFVNESGLYSVILRSDKPNAQKFRKWVTSEILPSIRKHGAYMTDETIEKALLSPDFLIRLATQLKEEKALNSKLAVDNQIMKPKADYFDELVERNTLTNFTETAKQLGIQRKQLISFLMDKKYLYRDKKGKLLPYENKNNGLFEVKESFNNKTEWSGVQTLITPKGRETIKLLIS
ncbi:phage antirepressor KilAC domain-containing protein [Anaerofustis stercorihominis]|uniref:phage antirepressor KilAC domain-containing protein n=1 Tax=Anaerofustis stercorihominis TaxID=214853 RepID=UPI002671B24E|nr:phage antirepressor KilAC domain-containing protein [Anaerofustis stercorihominis]